jgi:putative phosphoesterase
MKRRGHRGEGSGAHPRSEVRRFPLPEGGAVRVALVADTHGRPDARLAARLAALQPSLILHAGDIGDLRVLDALGAHAPVIAVRGNIDAQTPGVPDEVVLELTRDEAPVLRLLLTHIAVYGPKLRADVRRRAQAAAAQLVICGHSHVPFAARDGGLTVFNPGSAGPRRFHLPIVFGVLTVDGGRVELEHRDCETGEPWRPPALP